MLKRLQKFKASSKLRNEMMRVFIKYVSAENIATLNELFRKLDIHHTGYIQCSDLQNAIQKIGIEIPKEELEQVHKTSMLASCKGRAKINYTDFLINSIDLRDMTDEDTMWAAFNYFDHVRKT